MEKSIFTVFVSPLVLTARTVISIYSVKIAARVKLRSLWWQFMLQLVESRRRCQPVSLQELIHTSTGMCKTGRSDHFQLCNRHEHHSHKSL